MLASCLTSCYLPIAKVIQHSDSFLISATKLVAGHQTPLKPLYVVILYWLFSSGRLQNVYPTMQIPWNTPDTSSPAWNGAPHERYGVMHPTGYFSSKHCRLVPIQTWFALKSSNLKSRLLSMLIVVYGSFKFQASMRLWRALLGRNFGRINNRDHKRVRLVQRDATCSRIQTRTQNEPWTNKEQPHPQRVYYHKLNRSRAW